MNGDAPTSCDKAGHVFTGQGMAAIGEAHQHVFHPLHPDAMGALLPLDTGDHLADETGVVFLQAQFGLQAGHDLPYGDPAETQVGQQVFHSVE